MKGMERMVATKWQGGGRDEVNGALALERMVGTWEVV